MKFTSVLCSLFVPQDICHWNLNHENKTLRFSISKRSGKLLVVTNFSHFKIWKLLDVSLSTHLLTPLSTPLSTRKIILLQIRLCFWPIIILETYRYGDYSWICRFTWRWVYMELKFEGHGYFFVVQCTSLVLKLRYAY